jgi:hypothetical protein
MLGRVSEIPGLRQAPGRNPWQDSVRSTARDVVIWSNQPGIQCVGRCGTHRRRPSRGEREARCPKAEEVRRSALPKKRAKSKSRPSRLLCRWVSVCDRRFHLRRLDPPGLSGRLPQLHGRPSVERAREGACRPTSAAGLVCSYLSRCCRFWVVGQFEI